MVFVDDYQDGLTALHWAAREGRCKVLRLLIKRGADINARDNVSGLQYNRLITVHGTVIVIH